MNFQLGTVMDGEPLTFLKTTGALHGSGDGDQDQGAEVQASLTAFSRTDRAVPDYAASRVILAAVTITVDRKGMCPPWLTAVTASATVSGDACCRAVEVCASTSRFRSGQPASG
jgi:hypothetical protein